MGAQQLATLNLLAALGRADLVEQVLADAGGVDDPALLDRPLRTAVAAGHTGVVEALLGWNAAPGSVDAAGVTPMGLACADGHLGVVRLLLQWGADFGGLNLQGARWLAEFVGPLMDCYQHLHAEKDHLQAAVEQAQHEAEQRLAVIAAQRAEIDALRALTGQLQAGGAG